MQIKNFWVGEQPGGNWTFTVLDQRSGNPVDLTQFNNVLAVLMDSDNVRHEYPGNAAIADAVGGLVTFAWPGPGSPFNKAGRYQIQLELSNNRAVRKTTVQEILVREIGGVTR
jgi:hypothetical protein